MEKDNNECRQVSWNLKRLYLLILYYNYKPIKVWQSRTKVYDKPCYKIRLKHPAHDFTTDIILRVIDES